MCYPKPGPRCSAHARARYIKLHQDFIALQQKKKLSWGERSAFEKDIESAKLDFDSTPAGQARLELAIQQGHDRKGEVAERLANAKELRRLQLLAVKSKDKGDIHNHGDSSVSLTSGGLQGPEEGRNNLDVTPEGKQKIQDYLEYSQHFAQNLTTEESNALYWHTLNGSGVVNEYIAKKQADTSGKWSYEKQKLKGNKTYSPETVEHQIKTLDGIFERHPLPEPVVLYRGLGKNNLPDEVKDVERDSPEFKAYLADKYPVGKEISNPEYMSTSLNPAEAYRFSRSSGGNPVIMEVRTRQAVPMAVTSAWDLDEMEVVVNRNGRYKVVAIHENVTYENVHTSSYAKNSHNKNMMVIQLEEIVD